MAAKRLAEHKKLSLVGSRTNQREREACALNLLGQIVCLQVVGGTNHEQAPFPEIAKHLIYYFNSLCTTLDKPLKEKLTKALQQFVNTCSKQSQPKQSSADIAKDEMEELLKLNDSASFLMPGGWGVESSLVLYEFTKRQNTWDISVYSPSVTTVVGWVKIEREERGSRLLTFRNMPLEQVFLTTGSQSPSPFLQALIEPTRDSALNPQDTTAIRKILGRFHHVYPYADTQLPAEVAAKSMVTSKGAWKALALWLRKTIGDTTLYKKTILELKAQTLAMSMRAYHNVSLDPDTKQEMQLLLKGAASQLAWRTGKETVDISCKQALGTAFDVIGRLEQEAEQAAIQARPAHSLLPQNAQDPQQGMRQQLASRLSQAHFSNSSWNSNAISKQILPPPWVLPQADQLLQGLEMATNVCGKLSSHLEKSFYLEGVARSFPIASDDYWSAIQPHQAKGLLPRLDSLAHLFCINVSKPDIPFTPQFDNANLAFVAVAHRLALIADNGATTLKDYGLYWGFSERLQDRGATCLSAVDLKRRQELTLYFDRYTEKALFNWGALRSMYLKKTPARVDFEFFGQLIRNDVALRKAVGERLKPLCQILRKSRNNRWSPSTLESYVLITGFAITKSHTPPLADNYSYLLHLQRIAIRSQLSPLHNFESSNDNDLDQRTEEYADSCQCEIRYGSSTIPFSRFQTLTWHHRPSDKDKEAFLKGKGAARTFSSSESPAGMREAIALQKAREVESPFERELWRLAGSGPQELLQLLSLARDHLTLFQEVHWQSLFHIAFFRSISIDGKPEKQMLERRMDWAKDRKLLEQQFDEFIQTGLNQFWHQQPDGRPLIGPCLFFLESEIWFSGYRGSIEFPQTTAFLEACLDDTRLSREEKGALHLLAVFAASQRSENSHSIQDVYDTLYHWNLFCLQTPTAQQIHPLVRHKAAGFVFSLLQLLPPDACEGLPGVALKVVRKLDFAKENEGRAAKWNAQTPTQLSIDDTEYRGLTLDILNGKLWFDGGQLSFDSNTTIDEKTRLYKRIFHNRKIVDSRTVGPDLYFTDPIHGEMRLLKKSSNPTIFRKRWRFDLSASDRLLEQGLERKISGVWHRYMPFEQLEEGVPTSLVSDYTHWVATTGNKKGEVLFYARTDGAPRYRMDDEGTIKRMESPNHPDGDAIITQLGIEEETGIARFDRPEYILSQKAVSCEITFVRYASSQGEPLTFVQGRSKEFTYKGDHRYRLQTQSTLGHLGGIHNYLPLVEENTGAERLLVPIQPLNGTRGKTLRPTGTLLPQIDEEKQLQEGCFRFATYDVGPDGRLSPLDKEGALFLSYLALTQGDAVTSQNWLKKLSQSEPLSPLGEQILNWICEFSPRQTGGAASIRLQARLALQRRKRPVPHDFEPLFLYYLSLREGIEKELQITREDELELLGGVNTMNSRISDRIAYLEGSTTFLRHAHTDFPIKVQLDSPSNYYMSYRHEEAYAQAITNEQFRKDYGVASGGDEADKKALRYQLTVRELDEKPDQGASHHNQLLLVALGKPLANVPPLPDTYAKSKEIERWAKEIMGKAESIALPQAPDPLDPQPTSFQSEAPPLASGSLKVTQSGETRISLQNLFDGQVTIWKAIQSHQDSPFAETTALDSKALQEEYAWRETDLQAGRKRLSQLIPKGLQDTHDFKSQLTQEISKVSNLLETKKQDLLALARTAPTDLSKQLKSDASLLAHPSDQPTLAQLRSLFVKGNRVGYATANPHLMDTQIDQLYEATALYLDLENYSQQLKRVEQLMAELTTAEGAAKDKVHAKLWEETRQRQYDLKQYPIFSILENIGNISLRHAQGEMLEKMFQADENGLPRPFVGQLLMGQGKTTTIGSAWLAKWADGKKLPVFLVPPALLSPVRTILGGRQWERFGQEIDDIEDIGQWQSDGTREYTLASLKKALKKLNWLKEHKGGLILNHVTLRSLATTFLRYSTEFASNPSPNKDDHPRLVALADILLFFLEESVGLGDEFDQIMDMNFEVNSPTGQPVNLDPAELALIRQVYATASSRDLLSNEKTWDQTIGFTENRQALLSPGVLNETVIPALAEVLAAYPLLRISEKDKECFKRYVTGATDKDLEAFLANLSDENAVKLKGISDYHTWLKDLQQITPLYHTEEATRLAADSTFLVKVHEWHLNSNDRGFQEASNLIGLARGCLTTIFPEIVSWETGRRFGRKANGTVGPFAATGIPTTRDFGSPHVAASCYLQTALHLGISPAQIEQLCNVFTAAANRYVEKGENFSNTFEAKDFNDLIGVMLHLAKDPVRASEAAHSISQDRAKTLEVESRFAQQSVQYHPAYFTSTPYNLANQLPLQGMSGTLYNRSEFPFLLANGAQPDAGTEGMIIDQLLQRSVFETAVTQPKALLNGLFEKGDDVKAWGGLADAGGLLKNPPEEVAKAFSEALSDKESPRTTVLFFKPKKEEEHTPEARRYLHAWQRGAGAPILVEREGKSTQEAIEAAGIKPQMCFYYWDEFHITGIDLPPLAGKGFVTVDATMGISKLLQALLRYRDYFFGQEVHLVAQEGQEKETRGWVKKGVGNAVEELRGRRENVYRTAIAAAHDNAAMQQLLETVRNPNAFEKKVTQLLPVVQRHNPKNSYEAYGQLQVSRNTLQALESYADEKRAQWPFGKCSKGVKTEVESILDRARLDLKLPIESKGSKAASSDTQCQVELAQQKTIEIEQELLDEFENHQLMCIGSAKAEQQVNLDALIKAVRNKDKKGSRLTHTFSDFLKSNNSHGQSHYAFAFDEQFIATEAFLNPFDGTLPIFHRSSRPASQILVVKTTAGLRGVAVTLNQAKTMKKELSKNRRDGVWLVMPNGKPEVPFGKDKPDEKELCRLLIQVNFYNRKMSYLNNHETEAFAFLSSGNAKTKLRFLKVGVADDPTQKEALFSSQLYKFLSGDKSQSMLTPNQQREQRIRHMILKNPKTIAPHLVPYLDERGVKQLERKDQLTALEGSRQVRWVTPEQVALLDASQLTHLTEATQIQAVSPTLIKDLADWHLNLLKAEQITADDSSMTADQVSLLTARELVQKLPNRLFASITLTQVPSLSGSQIRQLKETAFIQAVPAEMCHELSDAQWVHLSENQLRALKNPALTTRLIPTQIPYLAQQEIIQALSIESLLYVTENQVPKLANDQFKHLTSMKQIQAVPSDKIRHLPNTQLRFLVMRQLEELQDVDVAPHLYPGHISYLAEQAVIQALPEGLVPHVTVNQVPKLANDQFKHLAIPEQIQAAPADRIRHLTDTQLESVSEQQLGKLQDTEVAKRLKDRQVPHLVHNVVIQALSKELVPHVIPSQVSLLADQQFEHLVSEAQIQATPVDKVQHLADAHLNNLLTTQVEKLLDRQVEKLNCAQLIQALPSAKVNHVAAAYRHHVLFQQSKQIWLQEHKVRVGLISMVLIAATLFAGTYWRKGRFPSVFPPPFQTRST